MNRCGVLSRILSSGQSSAAGLPPTLRPTNFCLFAKTRVLSQSISCLPTIKISTCKINKQIKSHFPQRCKTLFIDDEEQHMQDKQKKKNGFHQWCKTVQNLGRKPLLYRTAKKFQLSNSKYSVTPHAKSPTSISAPSPRRRPSCT